MKSYNPVLLSSYFRDSFIRLNFFFSLLLNILLWLGLTWQIKSFADLIALHYNIYYGIDWLGPWYQIFLLPALGLGFLLVNFIFGFFVYHQAKISSYFLAVATSLAQIIFGLAAIFVILINF